MHDIFFSTASTVPLPQDADSRYPCLYDPGWWDEVFHGPDKQDVFRSILELPADSDIVRVRQAHVMMNLGDFSDAVRHLEGVERHTYGIKLQCFIGMRLFDQIITTGYNPEGSAPIDFECAMYAEYALADAHSEKGDHEQALRHLHAVQLILRMLGLQNRLRIFSIEQERQNMLLGRPNSQSLIKKYSETHNLTTKDWLTEVLVEALLGEGQYEQALTYSPSLRNPGYKGFSESLMGRTPQEIPDSFLGSLTRALVALLNHEAGEVCIKTEGIYAPFPGYATLLTALFKYRYGQFHLAHHLLGDVSPNPPDQAFLWNLLRLGVAAQIGETNRDNLTPLYNALGRLGDPHHVLTLARRLLPSELALAANGAEAPAALRRELMNIPIMTGRKVEWGNLRLTVPKVLAQAMMLDAVEGGEGNTRLVYRAATKRYRDALDEYNVRAEDVVNIAWLWTASQRLGWHEVVMRLEAQSKYLQLLSASFDTNPNLV